MLHPRRRQGSRCRWEEDIRKGTAASTGPGEPGTGVGTTDLEAELDLDDHTHHCLGSIPNNTLALS